MSSCAKLEPFSEVISWTVIMMLWHRNTYHITDTLLKESTMGLPHKGPIMWCFSFFVLILKKLSDKQLHYQSFQTPWHPWGITLVTKGTKKSVPHFNANFPKIKRNKLAVFMFLDLYLFPSLVLQPNWSTNKCFKEEMLHYEIYITRIVCNLSFIFGILDATSQPWKATSKELIYKEACNQKCAKCVKCQNRNLLNHYNSV